MKQLFSFIKQKKENKRMMIILAVVIAFVAIIGVRAAKQSNEVQSVDTLKTVSLLDISSFQENDEFVLGTGEVESLAQVELRSEVSARITGVQVKLGQKVRAGQVIARFDGAQLAAQRAQAQADLQSAYAAKSSAQSSFEGQQATLEGLLDGPREQEVAIKESQLKAAEKSLSDAYADTKNLLRGVSTAVQSSIISGVDTLFSDVDSVNPSLLFDSANQALQITVEYKRGTLNGLIEDWKASISLLDGSSAMSEQALQNSYDVITELQTFLENLSIVVDDSDSLSETTQAAYQSTINSARTSMNAQLGAIQSHKQLIEDKKIAIEQAQEQLDLTLSGPTQKQIDAQQAAVNQAQSGLTIQDANIARAQATIASINAQLAKTSVRSPISGTIATLSAKVGELVSPGTLVASVVNTDGLQIKAYIDSSELSGISVGATTTIQENIAGRVTNIAPSIDPLTKKVEVIIAVLEDEPSIVIGQFVDIKIERSEQTTGIVLLPLRAIQVTTNGSFVFSVNEEGIVQKHEVVLNRVVGEAVEVVAGLDEVTAIISNVRDISEGMTVEVNA